MGFFLVTGGLGFIGSHLTKKLVQSGHRVRVLDDLSSGSLDRLPSGVELVQGSITDPAMVETAFAEVDGCFHLAAVSSVARCTEHWQQSSLVNTGGSVAIFECAARQSRPVPVVYMSSAAVYGDSAACPLSEDGETRPLTAYGADKLATELHARVAGGVYGLPTFGLRPFNVYGPGQNPRSPYSGVISIFLDRALRGEPLPILGSGSQSRDFIFVEDVVRFLVAAIERASRAAPVVNVCSGQSLEIIRLAEMLIGLTGGRSSLSFLSPRPGDIQKSQGDPRKATELLSVCAQTTLEDGLSKLIGSFGIA